MKEIKITSSNKKHRTITITKYFSDSSYVRYRSYSLTQEEFDFYTNEATEDDLVNFLNTDIYYLLARR